MLGAFDPMFLHSRRLLNTLCDSACNPDHEVAVWFGIFSRIDEVCLAAAVKCI